MKLRRVVTKRIDHDSEGLSVRAAIDAVVAVNVNESPTERPAEREPPAGETETKEASDG
jgi:hypothetical protein